MADIVLDHVTKRFPDGRLAVDDASLSITDGEFVILVGPSGCGKSTTLNMIAGLEDITTGELRIGGKMVNDLAPKDRDIAMVFQSYALYPHMTVRKNMGFALALAKRPKDEINRKVEEAAQVLDLTEHLDRKPAQLSGGQRQRVAMGRAIVRSPKAFLMDEPLSNLDAKLRVQMRTEVSRLQNRLGTTTVYVTHDQTEAMTLGDRVAVLRSGRIQQVGTPTELYSRPATVFVAGFIGSPAMNFVPATLEEGELRTPFGTITPDDRQRRLLEGWNGGAAGGRSLIVGARPEHFEDAALEQVKDRPGPRFTVTVDVLERLGSDSYAYFTVAGGRARAADLEELAHDAGTVDLASGDPQIVARLDAVSRIREGENAELWLDTDQLHLFDPDTGRNLDAPAAT
ncbi:sn-glycerol-3-phosphate ABC transporter ATP-binding protein UgpC [Frankia sp. CNm7]|uniref:Sn-glycerol-3-phosphate ABC transporter ATP-binding protein UgpC n=1 Tax=Frankia nepalensis TaxID=1836974 RepID=A0A937ULA4_9ACTN|nr:sn-glycerol-3-phosphate ABC transporter ATP-binding protein UgpC [Frankia nepalensis]MBL7496306.1 sn-glycerol-3-phosphate ABC transporter ATP-binding protein UgpC [Frankia nepalensis]MBL7508497.1 sn-glycerol-3-phosphate ABC transporter ATP-binding protein UgpC [Frankia nepalensis]MBL7520230.1 sn-glycerol-3-phosphate ABC transporter ATP-binding protein UgpC [Frankia nepalensis]MBL7627629.1 sn-glycerol-3-phosphate ABC transporter ATP-binding protein UgpC [Frankia nepalensis]